MSGKAGQAPLKELEDWHARATGKDPDHPLAAGYANHPLHLRTHHIFGFKMLDETESTAIDQHYLTQKPQGDVVANLPLAA